MDDLNLPPKAFEKRLAEVQEFLESVGMTATSRCTSCGSPLWAPASLEAGIGPVCAKHKNGVGILDQDSPDAA